MSELHPIIAITGSSGAGTTSVTRTFSNMFRREHVNAAIIEGDSFHRYDRKAMREAVAKADAQPSSHFSHFGHEANLFEDLEKLFADYAATLYRALDGRVKRRIREVLRDLGGSGKREVDRLRDELEDLRREHAELRTRLGKIEEAAKAKAGEAAAGSKAKGSEASEGSKAEAKSDDRRGSRKGKKR